MKRSKRQLMRALKIELNRNNLKETKIRSNSSNNNNLKLLKVRNVPRFFSQHLHQAGLQSNSDKTRGWHILINKKTCGLKKQPRA